MFAKASLIGSICRSAVPQTDFAFAQLHLCVATVSSLKDGQTVKLQPAEEQEMVC